jgi:adenylate cyclase
MPHPVSGPTHKQRLAAILAADAAGYSRLMSLDERATLDALDAAREVFRSHIEVNRGRVIDMAGDSVLAVFETAAGAVSAALATQAELAGQVADVAEDLRMQFRIGIHSGDVIEKTDGTVYGDGVNIAARLQALAEPGGIIVSESIHTAVRGKVPADFEDQGEQAVKNIAHPVRTWRVLISPSRTPMDAKVTPHPALPDKPSLAVLPFTNLSGDPEQEYFADGVVDDIITALSRVRAFFVIARNSSFTYKGKAVDIKQVGRELGVRYVLEGSIRRAGNRMRIVGQLIDAENGRHVWADRFEGNLDDVFELQDRITESVAGVIEPNLRLAEVDRARSKPAGSLQPYDLCLRAHPSLYSSSTRVSNDEAIALLKRAIDMDPAYVYAKALCAFAYALRHAQGWSTSAEDEAGIRLAEQALSDHHDDPAILSYAGHTISYLASRHEEGLHALDRALALSPNSSKALLSAGYVRGYVGDTMVAIEHFKRAMRLSPLDPEMGYIFSGLGFVYLADGAIEHALDTGLKAVHELPNWVPGHLLVTICLGLLGRTAEAATAGRRLLQLDPGFSISRVSRDWLNRSEKVNAQRITGMRAAGIPE